MSIYITNKTYIYIYIPNINLTKLESLKPSRFILFGLPCVYFEINFSGITPVHPKVTLRS